MDLISINQSTKWKGDQASNNVNRFLDEVIRRKFKTLDLDTSSKASTVGSKYQDNDMHVNLKLIVAQHAQSNLQGTIKESAYVMEEMLRALEKGKTKLSPKAK
jgi:hypothetical protein